MSLYRHTKTNQTMELVSFHGSDYALMRFADGRTDYVSRRELVEYDLEKGVTDKPMVIPAAEKEEEEKDQRSSTLPIETRLNINLASTDQIADRIKGVGYSTARKITELRSTMPGEKFTSLEQLRQVGRVEWDEVFKADLIFVG
jgi:DNA uptake protein ComE-like DNA-binding protein